MNTTLFYKMTSTLRVTPNVINTYLFSNNNKHRVLFPGEGGSFQREDWGEVQHYQPLQAEVSLLARLEDPCFIGR